MSERMTVNQRIQIAPEVTPGTILAATKILEAYTFDMGIKPEIKKFRGQGRKYTGTTEENKEWVEGKLAGFADYNNLPYLLSGAWGSASPALHGPSTTAYDWIWTPPLTGAATAKTFSCEVGDSVRAQKFGYLLTTGFNYKVTRDEFTCDAPFIGQSITDGITMTAALSPVALATAMGRHVNIYLDSTSAGLGTTLMAKALEFDYGMTGVYAPFWPLNRANASFLDHVDLPPAVTAKLLVAADAQGMGVLAQMQANTTYYLRMSAAGATIDVTNSLTNVFQHDMAVRVINVQPWKDDKGVYAIEWEFEVVEDSVWGKSQTATLTNLIASL